MYTEISKSQFKARALEIFRQVERSGEPVIITDRGRPTLELRPHVEDTRAPLERLKNSLLRYDDPFAPVGENAWEVLS